MHFAPAVQPQLLVLIDALDDDTRGIASIWRELGRAARARGLFQPSYETVRRLVHRQRRRRLALMELRRAAILTVELLLDAFDGARPRGAASGARSPSGTASRRGGP